jgi:hypothetical protein
LAKNIHFPKPDLVSRANNVCFCLTEAMNAEASFSSYKLTTAKQFVYVQQHSTNA